MTERNLPLVSIGIPTYNRADDYLRQALSSAVAQTYPNVEIVVSDNCSDYDTERVVRAFGDPRIRFFRQERNIGPIDNFNFCVREARGSYFLLLHDDDLIDDDLVESCVAAIGDRPEVGIVLTGARVIDAEGTARSERPNRLTGPDPADLILGWIRGRTSLFMCSTLYNTRRLKESGGFHSPRNLFLDVAATLRLSTYGRADVAAVKASFRRHESNNGSAARISDWADDSIFLIETMCAMAPDHAATVRREGMLKLCRLNYVRAQRVPDRYDRWVAFWTNYRKFGYCYSPVTYAWRRQLRRVERRFGRAPEPAFP